MMPMGAFMGPLYLRIPGAAWFPEGLTIFVLDAREAGVNPALPRNGMHHAKASPA